MKIEIDVKFNIGDKVKVLKPHSGDYVKQEPFIATIGGYVISKNSKSTRVYYTLTGVNNTSVSDYNRKKKYNYSELELIDDKEGN